jgi:hypothetical protein
LESCQLPEPDKPKDCAIDLDAAWFAGFYLAEGSLAGDVIQLSSNTYSDHLWERVQRIARKFGGSSSKTDDGNNRSMRVCGKILHAITAELIGGDDAHTKSIATVVWRYSNAFLASLIDGYLAGDGHNDTDNNRWRLGFCRNYNLERDLRVACARLGYKLTLKPTIATCEGKEFPSFSGEIRKFSSGYRTEKNRNEVIEIRKARCRYVYDLGVADEPHLFSLASGILTHNSKPNSMPESVTDRCTKSHEYIFLLSKSKEYYFDNDAIRERCSEGSIKEFLGRKKSRTSKRYTTTGTDTTYEHVRPDLSRNRNEYMPKDFMRNKRSVWTVQTQPFVEAHFATFPASLIQPCILAGCPKGGVVLDPFIGSGTTAVVAQLHGRNYIGIELNPEYAKIAEKRIEMRSVGNVNKNMVATVKHLKPLFVR